MSIETAAEYMAREPGGVRHLLEAKLLPSCRIDRRVQIRRVDIDRLGALHIMMSFGEATYDKERSQDKATDVWDRIKMASRPYLVGKDF
jgi:hypothetical protein